MGIVDGLRKELIRTGMRPNRLGKMAGRKVEFISYPWTAGQEIFVLVRVPNKPSTVKCVGADEVIILKGEQNEQG